MKKTILCLLLVLSLCLPACAEPYTPEEFLLRLGEVLAERAGERLADYDPSAGETASEPIDEAAGSEATEDIPVLEYDVEDDIVTFNGGSIKLRDALIEYEEMLALYEEFGMDPYEYIDDLKESVLSTLTEAAILEMKAKELGVYENTPEEQAAAEEEALYWYEDNLNYYKTLVYDSALSEDELTEAAAALMESDGVTYESILNDCLYTLWSDRLYTAVTADVTVDEDTLLNMYETGLSDAMSIYADDPEMFEYDYLYSIAYYRPEGYREVEYMLLPYSFEESDMSEEEKLASLTERFGDIIARAQNGESIYDLVDEFDCYDFGTLAVCENSTMMGDIFTAGAMALANGETSAPIIDEYGAWIIRCIGDIEPGETPFEDLRDAIYDAALASAQSDLYYEMVYTWIEEADVIMHPEMLP